MADKPEVLREFPPIGRRYRVRLMKRTTGEVELDCREHVETGSFTGFTRRGIKLRSASELRILRDGLNEVLDSGLMS